MPIIIHDENYIKKQKIINIILSILSLLGLIFFYIVYKKFTNSTMSIYLVIAALFSIPSGLFIVRFILIVPYKDCNLKISYELKSLPKYCYVINSAIFTDGNENKFIDNIIISNNNILCLIDNSKKYSLNAIDILKNILNSKNMNYSIKMIPLEEYSVDIIKEYIRDENEKNTKELFNIIKVHLI